MTGEKCYCRYCTNAYLQDDNCIWCELKKYTLVDRQITRQRKCKDFEFNPIDVLACNPDKVYKPKISKPKDDSQITFFRSD